MRGRTVAGRRDTRALVNATSSVSAAGSGRYPPSASGKAMHSSVPPSADARIDGGFVVAAIIGNPSPRPGPSARRSPARQGRSSWRPSSSSDRCARDRDGQTGEGVAPSSHSAPRGGLSTAIGFSPVAVIGSPHWRTHLLPAGGHRISPARCAGQVRGLTPCRRSPGRGPVPHGASGDAQHAHGR